jgi:hypothetical protein
LSQQPWGWGSTVAQFLTIDEATWQKSLLTHHHTNLGDLPLGTDQVFAWKEEYHLLRTTLAAALQANPEVANCLLAAEYELPGEAGRRPDVVLVTPTGHLIVLEFKQKAKAVAADYDQVNGYVRDLVGYHSASHKLRPHPVLVLTQASSPVVPPKSHRDVHVDRPVMGRLHMVEEILLEALERPGEAIAPLHWLEGEYQPLPTLVQAASLAFRNHELPRIKSVKHLTHLLAWLSDLAHTCEREKRHALVLVTGVPGSGKTLLGIQTVADLALTGRRALYLSGNGPLVGVLRDCINRLHDERAAKSLIRGMMEFKKGATRSARHAPANVYVFDEGQRAWTSVTDYAGTEIELLLEVAERKDWGLVIGLIGEGQEIYQKEHGDLGKWLHDFDARPRTRRWTVYVPEVEMTVAQGPVIVNPELRLDKTIRTKELITLHRWVNGLLSGAPAEEVAAYAADLKASKFPVYVTRDRAAAAAHVRAMYDGATEKRYGWVASSACKKGKRKNPDGLPQLNPRYYSKLEQVYGAWYNDPVDSPQASNRLAEAVSEFGCQGLELDFVLVDWGDDLQWTEGGWTVKRGVRLKGGKPVAHTLNAYRVLLTRSREGMVICCPHGATYQRLIACGLVDLAVANDGEE